MSTLLFKLFGQNYKTGASGVLAIVLGGVIELANQIELLNFIPDPAKGYIVGITKVLALFAAAYFVFQTKDKDVTGGVIPQTTEAVKRVDAIVKTEKQDEKAAEATVQVEKANTDTIESNKKV